MEEQSDHPAFIQLSSVPSEMDKIAYSCLLPPASCPMQNETLTLPCLLVVTFLILTWSEWWPHEVFHTLTKVSKHTQSCRLMVFFQVHDSRVSARVIDTHDSSVCESAKSMYLHNSGSIPKFWILIPVFHGFLYHASQTDVPCNFWLILYFIFANQF